MPSMMSTNIVMKKLSLAMAVFFCHQFILLHLVCSQDLDVISTQLSCPEVERPPTNHRWCYRTTYTMPPPLPIYQCNAAIIPKTNRTVKWVNSLDNNIYTDDGIPQTKIWSPNKIQGRNYQSNRYCLYKAACPPGHFMYYGWLNGNFELEPEVDGSCLDYVLIQNFDQPSVKLCGTRPKFVDQRSAPLEVTFRSNTRSSTRFPGFRIDVLCVSPFFANLPNCTQLNTTTSSDNTTTSSDNTTSVPPSQRSKRELQRNTYLPETLNSINIPRQGYIRYLNNVVKVIADGRIQRVFINVKYFFFWTGFKGTLAFKRSAPANIDIYGGGMLRVIPYIRTAFYSTVRIPPQFEPSEEAVEVISKLLNATSPFFLEDDPLDTDDPLVSSGSGDETNDLLDTQLSENSPIKPPYTTEGTPSPLRQYNKRVVADLAKKRRRRVRQTVDGKMDERVNQETLAMAETLENACDVFLREASRSYLRILEEFGIRRAT